MKLWPPDENFCTVTNNRKQNLPKNKIFQQKKQKKKKKENSKKKKNKKKKKKKKKKITLFEMEIILFCLLQNFLLFTKPRITSNFSVSRSI